MKKIFIGSLVGAIIMFVWGFLAWAILPIHLHTFMYSPAMDSVAKVMADNNFESGAYGVPTADNRNVSGFDSKYQEETQRVMTEGVGKPSITLFYKKEGYDMSGLTLFKGFLFNFLAVLAACIILMPAFTVMDSFFGRWWLVLLIGLLVAASSHLMNYNWMGFPWEYSKMLVMDVMVNWGITGLWLSWYFKNK